MTWKYKRQRGQATHTSTGVRVTSDQWLIYNDANPDGDCATVRSEAAAIMFCNELNLASRDD